MFSSNQSLLAYGFFSEDFRVFWYILSWILDQDLKADMSGDDEIDCIKAEIFLTRSGLYIATISNRN